MRDKDRLLRGLARLLPREFRERVFEPALADIQLDDVSAPKAFARAVLLLECVRLGVPEHFWRRGRPTLAAVVVVVVLAFSAMISARLRHAANWNAESVRTADR